MKIVDVRWRKRVSTYANSACEALVASVNSVNAALHETETNSNNKCIQTE